MKLPLVLLAVLTFNSPLLADEEPQDALGKLEICLATASTLEAKRACAATCSENAGSTMEINACGMSSYEIEEAEYKDTYGTWEYTLLETINNANPEESKMAREMLKRLKAYDKALPKLMSTKCSLAGTQMLGGSAESGIVIGCSAAEYRQASEFLKEVSQMGWKQ